MVRNLTDLLSHVVRRGRGETESPTPRERCFVCGAGLLDSDIYAHYRVCPRCRFHHSMTARERIDSLADPGTFREINRNVVSLDPLSFSTRVPYRQRLFRDQRRTGLTEAAVTGTCSIGGSPAMLIVLDFGFMGGSMGCVVGEKVALALERAAKERLPAVAVVTSGGARIQEGVLSLMQMAKTVMAASRLAHRGLPFISVLANPATGQAYASFANLADIILAEPGAIVGFAPLRRLREASPKDLDHDAHTAEAHLRRGMVDGVVDRTQLKDMLAVLLDLLRTPYRLTSRQRVEAPEPPDGPETDAWDAVQTARHPRRPTAMDYITRIFNNFVELHGDRVHGDDRSIVCGVGHLGGQTVMVVGQERGRPGDPEAEDRHGGRTSPEGFRKAQRVLRMAEKFQVPLVTLIDTPGPFATLEAEERGLGNAIASTMALMSRLTVPTISVVIGEGGSEGALALGVADRVLMLERAIYTVISPEEAADLIYRDQDRADEVAQSLRLTARDCRELGIVDALVPEPPVGAHMGPDQAAREVRRALLRELSDLQEMSRRKRLRERYKKFRRMGEYSSYFRAAITREVNSLQGLVATGVRRITRRRRGQDQETPTEPPSPSPPEGGDAPSS